jgi:hypothetical protein
MLQSRPEGNLANLGKQAKHIVRQMTVPPTRQLPVSLKSKGRTAAKITDTYAARVTLDAAEAAGSFRSTAHCQNETVVDVAVNPRRCLYLHHSSSTLPATFRLHGDLPPRPSHAQVLWQSGTKGEISSLPKEKNYIRFEVFTAVTMKNAVFWDETPCDSCKNGRFGGTQRLKHQAEKNQRSRNNVNNN